MSIDISTKTGLQELSRRHNNQAMLMLLAQAQVLHDSTLSDQRLQDGLVEYGTLMFHWDRHTLRRNLQEEISDARNYILAQIWQDRYKK